ncbi:MAG: pyruvate formate lyase family protein [Clostridiales bacterium]|nr:pyruvate formate lyase family protein [Clostridiales bacterium]
MELTEKAQKRISILRDHALNAHPDDMRGPHQKYCWLRGWLDASGCFSSVRRHGLAQAAMLENLIPVIDPGELIVGKPCYAPLSGEQQAFVDRFRDAGGFSALDTGAGGQASHMAVDYEKLLSLGINGVIAEVEDRLAGLCPTVPEDLEKEEFYLGCLAALRGVNAAAKIYSDHALKLASCEPDAERAAELRTVSETLSNVPSNPARSFREALQSVHFLTFLLNGLYQLGRPDRYLWKYYSQDIAAGILTPEDALELICCRDILDTEYIPRGLAIGYMVGGRDSTGRPVENELTHLFIKSIGIVRLAYPGTALAVHSRTSDGLLRLAAEQLAMGCSHPSLFNDEVITNGLRKYGLPAEKACEYVQSTCVEITPCASSAVWVATPYVNLPGLLLEELSDISSGAQPAPDSFEAFKADYRRRLCEKVDAEAANANRDQLRRFERGGDPLVSCFVNDCLARGKDIDRGGAVYNWIMPSFVGVANLCDSLVTIRDMVYGGELSFSELSRALDADFEGCAELHGLISNGLDKYGNDVDGVDCLVSEITSWIAQAVERNRTYRGSRFVPSLFCWIMHEMLGSSTGATPDGRRAGFPLGDGSGPAQGREKKGPTASILSSTKWDHTPFIGGIAVNLKFSKSMFGEDSVEKLLAIIRAYLLRGGFELQINVVDAETLRAAMADPDSYRDLVVRIGGYSDYFTGLNPNMQREVLLRTEHAL